MDCLNMMISLMMVVSIGAYLGPSPPITHCYLPYRRHRVTKLMSNGFVDKQTIPKMSTTQLRGEVGEGMEAVKDPTEEQVTKRGTKATGKELKLILFNESINRLVKSKSYSLAERRFARFFGDVGEYDKKVDLQPDLWSFNIMLNCYARQRHTGKAEMLFDRMIELEIRPDVYSYNTMVLCCSRAHKIEDAIKWFKKMEHDDVRPTIQTYNKIIDGLGRKGHFSEALLWLEHLRTESLAPNTRTYTSLICNYLRYKRYDQALETFQEMKDFKQKPNAITYCNLIAGLAKNQELGEVKVELQEKALEVFREFQKSEEQPDEICHTVVVELLGNLGRTEEAIQLFDGMAQLFNPRIVAYSTLFKVLGRAGRWRDFDSYMKRMESNNLEPNFMMFTAIFSGLRTAPVEEVIRYLDLSVKLGIDLDFFHYTSLGNHVHDEKVKKWITLNCSDDFKILAEKKSQNPQSSSSPMSSPILEEMVAELKKGNYGRALHLFQKMKVNGMQPSFSAYSTIVSELAKLKPKPKTKTGPNYELSKVELSEVEKHYDLEEKAIEIFHEMKSRMQPDEKCYSIIIGLLGGRIRRDGLERVRRRTDQALQLFDELEEIHSPLSETSYSSVLAVLARARRWSEFDSYIKRMEANNVKLRPKNFEIIIGGLRTAPVEELIRYLDMTLELGIKLDYYHYCSLGPHADDEKVKEWMVSNRYNLDVLKIRENQQQIYNARRFH